MRCEMSSDEKRLGTFTSGNLDEYLKEVAKEYRKMGGKSMPANKNILDTIFYYSISE